MFKSRAIAWSVWMTASIFYAYQYIIRVMPNIMLDDIMNQFHIDAAVFGQFSGVYYIGYSLMHLPIGIMLDRYGPKNVMSGCILLTVVGLLPILFAEHWVYPLVGRLLIGIGSSAAILGTFKIIRMAFAEKHFTRMLTFSVTIGLIGAIYGGAPVSYMCKTLGYKAVIEIFAMIGLALAVVTYVIVPKMESTNQGSVTSNIKLVLTNRKVITICLLAALMLGPLEGFADVWGAEFLKQVYGYDSAVASYLPSMIFMGMCFGAPVLSLIAEKTGRYVAVIAGAGLVMLLTFAALVAKMLTVSTMTISFVCVGVCCAYQILAIYKASTYVPEHVAGLTTAVANMIIMIFGWVFHTVIGCVINAYGGTKVASAFVYGIGVIPATLAVGVIGFLLIARTDQKIE
jgi:predicted MFS family arabinose efflux permease